MPRSPWIQSRAQSETCRPRRPQLQAAVAKGGSVRDGCSSARAVAACRTTTLQCMWMLGRWRSAVGIAPPATSRAGSSGQAGRQAGRRGSLGSCTVGRPHFQANTFSRALRGSSRSFTYCCHWESASMAARSCGRSSRGEAGGAAGVGAQQCDTARLPELSWMDKEPGQQTQRAQHSTCHQRRQPLSERNSSRPCSPAGAPRLPPGSGGWQPA